MNEMFKGCHELTYLDVSNFNTSSISDMKGMFLQCHNLKEIKGLKNWTTKNVLIMSAMFKDCYELEYLELSNFNTSNVFYMDEMFNKCYKLKKIKGINKFNLTNVVNLYKMFRGCFKLKDIALSKFSISKIGNKSIELMNQIKEKLSVLEHLKLEGEFQSIANKEETTKCLLHFITIDQLIKYSLVCDINDNFINVKDKLFLSFPSLKRKNLCFIANGSIINPSVRIKENRIKNNDVILINDDD